ncbi:unnamed protein product [Sphagnum compactum]
MRTTVSMSMVSLLTAKAAASRVNPTHDHNPRTLSFLNRSQKSTRRVSGPWTLAGIRSFSRGEISHSFVNALSYMEYHDFYEGMMSSEADNFPKTVQTLLLMAKPPVQSLPSKEQLDHLDNIVQCVNDKPNTKLSSHFQMVHRDKGEISDHVKEVVQMANEVKNFLQSSLQIDLESSISGRFGVGAAAVAVGALFALIAGQIELGLCLLSLLGGAGGYVIYKSRQSYQMVFNSYYEVLDLAIEEILKWTTTVTGMVETDVSFKQLVERAQCLDPKDEIQLETATFQDATSESKIRFLKRIKMVVETWSIYEEMVAGKCLVGIVGVEDIGKTTFINVSKHFPAFLHKPLPSTQAIRP